MVSEDSEQLLSGLLAVHRLSDLDDLNQPWAGQMMTGFDQLDAAGELLEVLLLRGVHRMLPEEWKYHLQQILPLPHDETEQVFFVVVVSRVGEHLSNPKELTNLVQAADALGALRDREFVRHLIAGSVAFPTPPNGLPDEADGEASFPVYKTNNPAKLDQPFLLIVRTQHVVTNLSGGSEGYTGFPAYSRMLSRSLLKDRATIVTLGPSIVVAHLTEL